MIIGIAGNIGHGKNFYAQIFEKTYKFLPYSFAYPIRLIAQTMFGWKWEQMDGPQKEVVDMNFGLSFRDFATVFGTDFSQHKLSKFPLFKKITGRKIWVKWFKRWYETTGIHPDIVITDIRFPHEVEGIHEVGGYVVRVTRPSMLLKKSQIWKRFVRLLTLHESERYISKLDVDFEIQNNEDTLEEAEKKIETILTIIKNYPQY